MRGAVWGVLAALELCLLAGATSPQQVFLVRLTESRSAVQGDEQRKGLDVVDRRLQVDNLSMWYHRLVDPAHADQVKSFGYGDFFMNCRFGGFGNGGWDMEYFLAVTVGYPDGPQWNLISDLLQEGIYVIEQTERAVVDLVWPVPPRGQNDGGKLIVTLVKWPGATRWAYLQVRLQATQGAELRAIRISGYPGNTSGPPERERWACTPLQDANLQTGATLKLSPQDEWAVAMYNRNGQEEDANLAVFLPEQVQSAAVSGTYGVGLELIPTPGRDTIQVAFGFYTGQHYSAGNREFLAEAPKIQQTLREVRWSPDVARMVELQALAEEYAAPLALPGVQERMGAEVQAAFEQVRTLQQALLEADLAGRPLDRTKLLELVRQIERLRGMRDRLYDAAVHALVDAL